MPEIANKETVNVKGKNYIIEDLSDKSKYFLGQLQDLGQQQRLSTARLHQIEMAVSGFEKEFEASLKEEPESDVIE
jgi:hypothetical protein